MLAASISLQAEIANQTKNDRSSTSGGTMTARGIRNCNPGNIRHNATFKWQGEVGADEQNFIKFDLPMNGIRALARDIRNKIRRGLHSLAEILPVYAPPSENDTDAYIASVCKQTGFDPGQDIAITVENIAAITKAIITHENGSQPYDDYLITQAVQSALG